jgi:hypothetical protein
MPQSALNWTKVDSSNVDSVAYDAGSETLCVKFQSGDLYSYKGVNMEIYTSLVYADSVGKYLSRVIKGVYPYLKHTSEADLLSDIKR